MTDQRLKKTCFIAGFRILGSLLSFIIPIYLSRSITIDGYGSYKAFILIQSTAMYILPLGVDGALLYFLQKDAKHHHIYGLNILLFTIVTGGFSALIFLLFSKQFAHVLQLPSIETLKYSFSLFLISSLMTNHIYIYFIFRDKAKIGVIIEFISQLSKTILIVFGFHYFEGLDSVFWLLSAFYLSQLCCLMVYHGIGMARLNPSVRMIKRLFIKQIQHGLPLGFSNLASYFSDLDKLVVSSLFGARSFALFTTGCFKVPFIHAIESTILDMMGMSMVKHYRSKNLPLLHKLWRDSSRQILCLLFPVCIFLSVFSQTIITLIFSDRYTESIPIFSIFILLQALNSQQPDMLFRCMNATKTLMRFQTAYAVLSFALVAFGAFFYGIKGAIVAKLLVHLVMFISKMGWYRRSLGLKISDLYDWKPIFQIISISFFCALLAKHLIQFTFTLDNLFFEFIYGGLVYLGLVYVAIFHLRAFHSPDKDYIEAWFKSRYALIKGQLLVRLKTSIRRI